MFGPPGKPTAGEEPVGVLAIAGLAGRAFRSKPMKPGGGRRRPNARAAERPGMGDAVFELLWRQQVSQQPLEKIAHCGVIKKHGAGG